MELRARAKFYTRVAGLLYAQQGLRGRVVKATRGARHLSIGVRLANPMHLKKALGLEEELAVATNTIAVIAGRLLDQPGLVTYQFQLQSGYWQRYTRADVSGLGVGLGESKHQVDFGFDPPHALVAGTTGSGKTETLKSILAGLMTNEPPDRLNAVLVDPQHDLDVFYRAAHLQGLPIAHDHDEIERALIFADQELARRKASNLRDGPRVVVAVDDAENWLDGEWLTIAQRIAADGRKFRMHLIVSTQKPGQKKLPDLVHLLNNRFVGLVDNAQTSAMLTGQAGLGCHKLTGKGDFVHVAGNLQERFQAAMATEADFGAIPRGDVQPPVIDDQDSPHADNFEPPDDDRGPGRPANTPEPLAVATYVFYGPDDISIAQAREQLDLSKRGHYLNREFAREIEAELIRLVLLAMRDDEKQLKRFFRRLLSGGKA